MTPHDPRPVPLTERLAGVLDGVAEDRPVPEILNTLLDGPALLDEDQAAFYALVTQAAQAYPEAAGDLADAFVDLADHLVLTLAPDRSARIECALAWYLAAGEIYGDDLASLTYLRTRVATALPHRLVGDHAENVADAVATAQNAVSDARDLDDPWLLAAALAALGSVLLEGTPQPHEARMAFEEAASCFLMADDPAGWAEALLDAAVAITEADLPLERDARADALSHAADLCAAVAADLTSLPHRISALAALAAAKVAIARGGPGPLEQAVSILEASLDGPVGSLHLADEAKLHVNLGVAYGARLLGDPEENLERAIQAFSTARALFADHLPLDAALSDLNLAAAYGERVRGDAAQNVRLAISAARRARDALRALGIADLERTASLNLGCLLVRDEPFSPSFDEGVASLSSLVADASTPALDRALAQSALASAHAAAGLDPAPMLRQAAEAFERLGADGRWGQAICDLAEHSPDEEAAGMYRRLLARLSREVHPSLHLRAAQALGALSAPSQALDAARLAVRAALHLADLAPDDPFRAQALAEGARPVLAAHVRLATEARLAEEAHGTVLQALGLNLLAGLGTRAGDAASAELRHETLRRSAVEGLRLRDDLRPVRGRLAHPSPTPTPPSAQAWRDRDEQLRRVSLSPLLPSPTETILTTFVGPDGLWTGWQVSGAPLRAQWHGPDALRALDALTEVVTSTDAAAPWVRPAWSRRLDEALERFSESLGLGRLVADLPSSCTSLVVRPHRGVHLVPFAALPTAQGPLSDRFPGGLTLLPLPVAHARAPRPVLTSFVALDPPTSAPTFADLELCLGQVDARHVPSDRFAPSVVGASALHIATHASLGVGDPLAATLEMEAGQTLRPYDLPLTGCSLVTLAACGSGQVDLEVAGSDVVGLQSAFLLAGAHWVLASLWHVDDAAAAVLLGRFYAELSLTPHPPEALAAAQRWTRTATTDRVRSWAGTCADPRLHSLLDGIKPGSQPFACPADWAAFTLFGARLLPEY